MSVRRLLNVLLWHMGLVHGHTPITPAAISFFQACAPSEQKVSADAALSAPEGQQRGAGQLPSRPAQSSKEAA